MDIRYFYSFILGLGVISTLLPGCGEDAEPKKFTLKQGNYMVSGKIWQLTGKTVNGTDALPACSPDDSLFFQVIAGKDEEGKPNPDKFWIMPGSVPCANETEVTDTLDNGTWELSPENSRTGLAITMYGQDDTVTAPIERVSGKFLTLSYVKEEEQVREEYISVTEE